MQHHPSAAYHACLDWAHVALYQAVPTPNVFSVVAAAAVAVVTVVTVTAVLIVRAWDPKVSREFFGHVTEYSLERFTSTRG